MNYANITTTQSKILFSAASDRDSINDFIILEI